MKALWSAPRWFWVNCSRPGAWFSWSQRLPKAPASTQMTRQKKRTVAEQRKWWPYLSCIIIFHMFQHSIGIMVGWLVRSPKDKLGGLQQAATASNHGIAGTPTWSLQDPYLSKRPKQLHATCSCLIYSFQNNRARRTSSWANKATGM